MLILIRPLFIGTTELILIGGIALLLFGGKKLPEMMRGLGKGMSEFKKGMNEPDSSEGANEETNEEAGETQAGGEEKRDNTDTTDIEG
ncbi:MAG: twin-arginine translocase TatA/TatE family subunit [Clostridia bacterium]|nr:twin-arginine translocase TatA/TatE family subunit [Clostridia bacterium]